MARRFGSSKPWWQSDKDHAHTDILATVTEIESRQSGFYERCMRLERLYDPNSGSDGGVLSDDKVVENVIASTVDTVVATVAATDVRARFMTDGADWSMQRQARHLEWYAEGVATQQGVAEKCRAGFKGSAKKGTGLNHVYVDRFDQLRVEPVIVDDIIVDENETRYGGTPKQMHRRCSRDPDELKAEYPGFDEQIDRAMAAGGKNRRMQGSGGAQQQRNEVHVIHSWRLPVGMPSNKKTYKPGRYVVSIDSCDLFDVPWTKAGFPFAVIRWSEREGGWFGISLSERLAGHQRALNKRNWQINRVLDQGASLTTYVRPADANLMVKTTNTLGQIAVVKGDYPQTVAAPQVHPEVYANREQLKASAFEESGISRMAAQSVKPAGIDSGVAMREYRDQTTQRFSMQEKAFEQFVLDTILLVLDCCKDMDKAAPVIMKRTKFGARKITWSKVDMGDVEVQISAASTLSRTPAGRIQTVLEWAQAGVISQDETRRLLQHPDLERAMSLYTAALESVEYCFDEIADGHTVMPEPFMNLDMIKSRGTSQYLKWSMDAAPERVLEGLRQFIVQATYMLDQAANPEQGNMPMAGPAPVEAPPQAALAGQAMQLRSA